MSVVAILLPVSLIWVGLAIIVSDEHGHKLITLLFHTSGQWIRIYDEYRAGKERSSIPWYLH
jgi:hypothetical protein